MSTRAVATAHSIVGFTTCACLLIFYATGEPFGSINDVGNAALGILSLVLAWLVHPSRVLVGVAAVGTVLTIVGTVLVMSGITGYYLAGLWSSAGFALIGVWLVGSARQVGRTGLVAGVVMLLGLIGVPGIFLGIDDLDTAPVWTFVAGASWAGTYLLFPAWSLRLARQDRAESVA
ncbi:hypothetical protein [Kribbella jiaozuonensis]|uniref:Uncharacterized protein n=1 Tax=Kribbella jiaozuonensis TaxID=2575441 RepID=A0A4U3LV16_9ACTN|nr:hypothetical protein [Kribbella jiaozuonensis]TKK79978.1 hypothetical protein FDA38_16630 [Kribbella jiaozuonensis]